MRPFLGSGAVADGSGSGAVADASGAVADGSGAVADEDVDDDVVAELASVLDVSPRTAKKLLMSV